MNLLRAPWLWAALAVPIAVGAVLTPDGSLAGVLLGALTAIALVAAVALLSWPSATVRRVVVGILVLAGGVWAGGLAGVRLRHWLENHEALGVVAALVLLAAMLIVPFVVVPVAGPAPPSDATLSDPEPSEPEASQPRPSPIPRTAAEGQPSPRPRSSAP